MLKTGGSAGPAATVSTAGATSTYPRRRSLRPTFRVGPITDAIALPDDRLHSRRRVFQRRCRRLLVGENGRQLGLQLVGDLRVVGVDRPGRRNVEDLTFLAVERGLLVQRFVVGGLHRRRITGRDRALDLDRR